MLLKASKMFRPDIDLQKKMLWELKNIKKVFEKCGITFDVHKQIRWMKLERTDYDGQM